MSSWATGITDYGESDQIVANLQDGRANRILSTLHREDRGKW